jgi:hypothetical protein
MWFLKKYLLYITSNLSLKWNLTLIRKKIIDYDKKMSLIDVLTSYWLLFVIINNLQLKNNFQLK